MVLLLVLGWSNHVIRVDQSWVLATGMSDLYYSDRTDSDNGSQIAEKALER